MLSQRHVAVVIVIVLAENHNDRLGGKCRSMTCVDY